MSGKVDRLVGRTLEEKRALLAELLRRKASQCKTFPLSLSQRRYWALQQLHPDSSVCNIPAAVRTRGCRWRIREGQRALNEVVARHEILRTTFPVVNGEVVQRIAPPLPVPLPVVDLSGLTCKAQEAQLAKLIDEEARRPFDLARGPLTRFQLLHLADDEQVIVSTLHHTIGDAWSIGVLIREILALYFAFCENRPSPLPRLPAQYADFTRWQLERLQGDAFEKQLAYWTEKLRGAPAALDLPVDRPRPPTTSYRGARRDFAITSRLAQQLRELARSERATLFAVLLAAFQTWLYQCTGQDDICVGSPVSGRVRPEFEDLIGCCVNTVVFRAQFSDQMPFRQLLARVSYEISAAMAHQDVPFERLVETLQPQPTGQRTPLFQVLFALSNPGQSPSIGRQSLLPGVNMNGLEVEFLPTQPGTALFDLGLVFRETPDRLLGTLEYSTDLFDPTTIDRFIASYGEILAEVAVNARMPVGAMRLFSMA